MVELVGEGLMSTGLPLLVFFVSVLLLASVKRFGVSRMRDFLLLKWQNKLWPNSSAGARRWLKVIAL